MPTGAPKGAPVIYCERVGMMVSAPEIGGR